MNWKAMMTSFHKLLRVMMVMLGLFEFWSASQWYLYPKTEQSNTHILPPDIVDPKAHFVTPWIMFLVALGCVRIMYGASPESLVTWLMTLLTHIFEELFWLIYAKQSSSDPNATFFSLIIDAAKFKDQIFHNTLVLVGPLLLILFLIFDLPQVIGQPKLKTN